MQVLYVVDFDIDGVPSDLNLKTPDQIMGSALQCVADWINVTAIKPLSTADLRLNGLTTLKSSRPDYTRKATWQTVGIDDCRAMRLEVRDKNEETEFLTRARLGLADNQVTLRVTMGRVLPADWLSPAPPADLRQPGLIQNFLNNEQISLRVKKQRQDGKYIQIRSESEIATLIDVLQSNERLPILIIHTRTLSALNSARTAANKLVGLVRVVTVDYSALSQLTRELPDTAPAYASARLVWSDMSAASVEFDSHDVNGVNSDALRVQIMNKLSPISVLSRGSDDVYRRAHQAQSAARSDTARERSHAAAATGDLSAQITLLGERVQELQSDVQDWQTMALEAEAEANQTKVQAERVPGLEEKVNQLSIALRAMSPGLTRAQEIDPWRNLPKLESGSKAKDTAQALYLRLQEVTSEKIIFTDRALTSWKKARYPYPEEMHEALIKLARVAAALYDGSNRTMTHLDQWMREEFDLKIALQDDTIQKSKSLSKFTYEDRHHDRTPHVKVRDNAPHQEVGRIHFALDATGSRIIVDHVGIKLY